jgi:hypothetical protein
MNPKKKEKILRSMAVVFWFWVYIHMMSGRWHNPLRAVMSGVLFAQGQESSDNGTLFFNSVKFFPVGLLGLLQWWSPFFTTGHDRKDSNLSFHILNGYGFPRSHQRVDSAHMSERKRSLQIL